MLLFYFYFFVKATSKSAEDALWLPVSKRRDVFAAPLGWAVGGGGEEEICCSETGLPVPHPLLPMETLKPVKL